MQEKIIAGEKYNLWTALEQVVNKRCVDEMWLCECRCGRRRRISKFRLLRYKEHKEYYNGCGYCEKSRYKDHPRIIVNGKKISAYSVWCNMKNRCSNPDNPVFKHYGGRGITVCDEWNYSFIAFYNYVSQLEHYDEPGRSLDRIDNDKGYFPGNVRWATAKEQANNKRQRQKRGKTNE